MTNINLKKSLQDILSTELSIDEKINKILEILKEYSVDYMMLYELIDGGGCIDAVYNYALATKQGHFLGTVGVQLARMCASAEEIVAAVTYFNFYKGFKSWNSYFELSHMLKAVHSFIQNGVEDRSVSAVNFYEIYEAADFIDGSELCILKVLSMEVNFGASYEDIGKSIAGWLRTFGKCPDDERLLIVGDRYVRLMYENMNMDNFLKFKEQYYTTNILKLFRLVSLFGRHSNIVISEIDNFNFENIDRNVAEYIVKYFRDIPKNKSFYHLLWYLKELDKFLKTPPNEILSLFPEVEENGLIYKKINWEKVLFGLESCLSTLEYGEVEAALDPIKVYIIASVYTEISATDILSLVLNGANVDEMLFIEKYFVDVKYANGFGGDFLRMVREIVNKNLSLPSERISLYRLARSHMGLGYKDFDFALKLARAKFSESEFELAADAASTWLEYFNRAPKEISLYPLDGEFIKKVFNDKTMKTFLRLKKVFKGVNLTTLLKLVAIFGHQAEHMVKFIDVLEKDLDTLIYHPKVAKYYFKYRKSLRFEKEFTMMAVLSLKNLNNLLDISPKKLMSMIEGDNKILVNYYIDKFNYVDQTKDQLIDNIQRISFDGDDNIPDIEISAGKYKIAKVKDAVKGLFLGDITNCCQHPGGGGEFCAYYGVDAKNSGFYAIYKGSEIVVQSFVWTYESTFVVDSIESIDKKHRMYKDVIQDLYIRLFDAILASKQFDTIVVGREYGELREVYSKFKYINKDLHDKLYKFLEKEYNKYNFTNKFYTDIECIDDVQVYKNKNGEKYE